MDIKEGEYVRTECGIAKIKNIEITDEVYELDKDIMYVHQENWKSTCSKSEIVKHSKNLIDLIEVGDIVNNGYIYEVGKTKDGHKWVHNLNGLLLFENDIKTILTHEQYNQNCYKVKGE